MALKKAERKGMEIGIEKGKKEMVTNLLKLGVEISKIIEASGLSEEDIIKLKYSIED